MIALKRILVPHDFSETSLSAVSYAVSLARQFGAEIVFIHVTNARMAALESDILPGGDGVVRDEAVTRILDILSPADKAAVHPRVFVRTGAPATEIVRLAREQDIDLIVMGTHGRGLIGHMVMGSVAEIVVRTAGCPVLTVRNAQPERAMSVAAPYAEARPAV